MKKRFLFLLTLVLSMTLVTAQSVKDIFDPKIPVTWLGLDFTAVKIIGDHDKYEGQNVNKMFHAWNDLVFDEASKYDVAAATERSKVSYNVDITNKKNDVVETASFLSANSEDHHHLKKETIQSMVSNYDFSGLTGIGLMFIVESFNKRDLEASVYVTFINMSTKEVLLTERMTAPPAGFGVRNYWAGAIYKIMNNMKAADFNAWSKKYK